MAKKKVNIDQFYKENLGDLNFPVGDADFNAIQKGLGKKPRRFLWFWIIGLTLLIGSTTILYTWYDNGLADPAVPFTNNTRIKIDTGLNGDNHITDDTERIGNVGNNSAANSNDSREIQLNQAKPNIAPIKVKNEFKHSVNSKLETNSETRNLINQVVDVSKTIAEDGFVKKEIKDRDKSNSALGIKGVSRGDQAHSSPSNIDQSSNEEKDQKVIPESKIEKGDKDSVKTESQKKEDSYKEKKVLAELEHSEKVKPTTNQTVSDPESSPNLDPVPNPSSKLRQSIYLSGGLISPKFIVVKGVDENDQYEPRKNNELGSSSIGFGLGYHIQFANLGAKLGLQYQDLQFENKNFTVLVFDSIPFRNPIGDTIAWIYKNHRDSLYTSAQRTSYKRLSIPLRVTYEFALNKRFVINAGAGIVANIPLIQSGNTIAPSGVIQDAATLSLKNWSYQYLFELGGEYRVRPKLNLGLSASFAEGAANIFTSTQAMDVRLNNLNLNMSLRYELY